MPLPRITRRTPTNVGTTPTADTLEARLSAATGVDITSRALTGSTGLHLGGGSYLKAYVNSSGYTLISTRLEDGVRMVKEVGYDEAVALIKERTNEPAPPAATISIGRTLPADHLGPDRSDRSVGGRPLHY